jgi:hypothetical protein
VSASDAVPLPEQQVNDLLRRADWRFLLQGVETPRIVDLAGGWAAEAVGLIGLEETVGIGADVALIGFPTRLALGAAVDAVRPGGEVVCVWRVPRPGAVARATRRLRRAGLEELRVAWPGPLPFRSPQFWLPLRSEAAASHLLAERPPASRFQATLRPLWRVAARAGLLTPLCAIGRLPGGEVTEPDGVEAAAPASQPLLLLTGGRRSINKVVGLPIEPAAARPRKAVKFARAPAADAALEREAEALRTIEAEHPELPGVPRVLAEGRRAGRRALVESAVHGTPLIERLSPASFEGVAGGVTGWLSELARGRPTENPEEWRERLVGERLATFERSFGPVLSPGLLAKLEQALEGLGPLPRTCEHRDCSPWNVVLDEDGVPGLHDWESAEPRGLPGLDLAYFLANCAFVLDGALESRRTRESHARLLDPDTPHGAVAARCAGEYCRRVGISAEDYARLRLLAWLVHSASDHTHLAMESGGSPDPGALRASTYLGLIEAELEIHP